MIHPSAGYDLFSSQFASVPQEDPEDPQALRYKTCWFLVLWGGGYVFF